MILDEYSIISKDFLAVLSRNISIDKETVVHNDYSQSFGGINIIICSDFHQFPPVTCPVSSALYYPSDPKKDSINMQLGHAIYEEFLMVAILKEQMRVKDLVWLDFLHHLQHDHVEEQHVGLLKSLIIGRSAVMNVDFEHVPWSDACLITPRLRVRTEWNDAAIWKMC